MDDSGMVAATLGIGCSARIIVKRLERTNGKRTIFRTPTWLRRPYVGPRLQITDKMEVRVPADEVNMERRHVF
jgi:hypothetical protein